jgi:hypothetical protein
MLMSKLSVALLAATVSASDQGGSKFRKTTETKPFSCEKFFEGNPINSCSKKGNPIKTYEQWANLLNANGNFVFTNFYVINLGCEEGDMKVAYGTEYVSMGLFDRFENESTESVTAVFEGGDQSFSQCSTQRRAEVTFNKNGCKKCDAYQISDVTETGYASCDYRLSVTLSDASVTLSDA